MSFSSRLLQWLLVFILLLLIANLCTCKPVSIEQLMDTDDAHKHHSNGHSHGHSHHHHRRIRQLEKLLAQMVKSKNDYDGFVVRPGK